MSAQIKLTHTFEAPRELVFQAFTKSEHLQNWWGPKGWAFEVLQADFRPGGVFHYSQKPEDGNKMWVKFEYSEIVESEKIVYTSYFSDAEGNKVRAPFDENWPMGTLTTLTFTESEGKTILTVVLAPVSPTEAEDKIFRESKDMVKEGFSGTFDQLAEYLLKIS
ncbi:SRPBCC domain-containing protein [Brevibacillus sp. GCM10020057]|uniref:SRPBCC family protein n=1 Tax=Brevibacillus sp. GCM10020057 TaxID=3317327 RepID=UPI00362F33F3